MAIDDYTQRLREAFRASGTRGSVRAGFFAGNHHEGYWDYLRSLGDRKDTIRAADALFPLNRGSYHAFAWAIKPPNADAIAGRIADRVARLNALVDLPALSEGVTTDRPTGAAHPGLVGVVGDAGPGAIAGAAAGSAFGKDVLRDTSDLQAVEATEALQAYYRDLLDVRLKERADHTRRTDRE